jgi:hypothetical protein
MVSEPVLTIASKNSRSLARSGMVAVVGSVNAERGGQREVDAE